VTRKPAWFQRRCRFVSFRVVCRFVSFIEERFELRPAHTLRPSTDSWPNSDAVRSLHSPARQDGCAGATPDEDREIDFSVASTEAEMCRRPGPMLPRLSAFGCLRAEAPGDRDVHGDSFMYLLAQPRGHPLRRLDGR
jgi:hypothetical protein